MKNPIVANWIRIKKISDDEYMVKDLLFDEQFKINSYKAWFIKQLSKGIDPYKIDKNLSVAAVKRMLLDLEYDNIIRDKRFYEKSFLNYFLTIWKPQVTFPLRVFSFFINALLFILWLPVLAFSVYLCLMNWFGFAWEYMLIGSAFGILGGIVMHELGHMFACLAYGGRVFEVGVMLHGLTPGAYVLLNESCIKKRMRRVQVSAAGVEMNFLLAGIFLLLSNILYEVSGFFVGAALSNIILGLLNLTFINGFDGMNIMSELLGVEDVVRKARRVTQSRVMKRKLKKTGMNGRATIAACYVIRMVQIAYPMILIINILAVFLWI